MVLVRETSQILLEKVSSAKQTLQRVGHAFKMP